MTDIAPEAIAFVAGFIVAHILREPGWIVTLFRDGKWVWKTARVPCSRCPLVDKLRAASDPAIIRAALEDVHDMDVTLDDYARAVAKAVAKIGETP